MKLNHIYPVCRAFVLYVSDHSDTKDYFEYQHHDYVLSAKRHSFNFWFFTLSLNGKVIYKDMDPTEFGYIIEIDGQLEHLEAA